MVYGLERAVCPLHGKNGKGAKVGSEGLIRRVLEELE